MPKVSIVVPVYNTEKYIHQCVDSLLCQTLEDIEIILVDDESPDRCPQICEEYKLKDKRIKVIHKKNEGLGLTRNAGMKIATGEYIAFVDSDDYVDPETYQKLYVLATERQANVVYFAYERFNEQGHYGHSDEESLTAYNTKEKIRRFMLDMVANPPHTKKERNIEVSSCCALYQNELIRKNKIEFCSERELISEDLVFNLDYLLCSTNVLLIPCSYYKYRENLLSLSQKVRKDRIEKNYIFYEYILNWLYNNDFGHEGYLRATRFFIGYSRSSIRQYVQSQLSNNEKMEWLREVLDKDMWKKIAAGYPYWRLPKKYALHFYLLYNGYCRLLFYYSKL